MWLVLTGGHLASGPDRWPARRAAGIERGVNVLMGEIINLFAARGTMSSNGQL